jgi:putative membrane-bound dehydrogenase-like protein
MKSSFDFRAKALQAIGASLCTSFFLAQSICLRAEDEFIPRAQSVKPGPALSVKEAIAKMTLPKGFRVECFASEPDLVNPVSMAIDEKGRVWVTESLEYPRREPGVGRDRVKVLEDTNGDGKADKVTIFAEGLNIPSGIAVGHGGVWVANSPDLLFLQDTDGDGKADKKEIVVTGFGRDDTHELPNSLTWGPDGWLYGLNGVFNPSVIKHQGKEFRFTCALFRIHPKTREFQIFSEGTSNPWGVAINENGSFFVSACVIDHLWHLAESAYYLRQGGPYPPFTWHLNSIVNYKHQKAAYCGINWFDSPAYPKEYREKLYMGNIHGGCINVDGLERNGSTYRGKELPDFLSANDAWFMPVVQKTGPDGCLWILDWYDRYHCYQDANRDPKGIDRLNGRLYRVVYDGNEPAKPFDLSKKSNLELLGLLGDENVFYREQAQRLITERIMWSEKEESGLVEGLSQIILDEGANRKARMHALWALGSAGPLQTKLVSELAKNSDPTIRAWVARLLGNQGKIGSQGVNLIKGLARDTAPDVLLQVAIAADKIEGLDPLEIWNEILKKAGNDPIIPNVIWQNLHPRLPAEAPKWLELTGTPKPDNSGAGQILARLSDKLLSEKPFHPEAIDKLLDILSQNKLEGGLRQFLGILALRLETQELAGPAKEDLRTRLLPEIRSISLDQNHREDIRQIAAIGLALFGDSKGIEIARGIFENNKNQESLRRRALQALLRNDAKHANELVISRINDPKLGSSEVRGRMVLDLAILDQKDLAITLLKEWSNTPSDIQARIIDLLTGRPYWTKELLSQIAAKKIPTNALNANTVRKIIAFKDPVLIEQVGKLWGTLREGRNPEREQVVKQMNEHLRKTAGNPMAGPALFQKACAQCHKIYGQGQEVGPDITSNGRANFDQLVSNVFDPSLVIGTGYQATTVATVKGKIFTGLLVENSKERVVLKVQGGALETIPRSDIEDLKTSANSLMPEGMEKQLTPREWADLFAYLSLDRPPTDKNARKIPSSP